MPPDAAEVRIFGAVVLDQRRVMERLVGRDSVARVAMSLPRDRRVEYQEISALGWCRHGTATTVTAGVAHELGRCPKAFVREVVRTGVEHTFRSGWRFLLRRAEPEIVARRAAMLYSKICDRGRLVSSMVGPRHATLVLHDWPEIEELDIIAIASGVEAILRVAGQRETTIAYDKRDNVTVFDVRGFGAGAALL